MREVVGFRTVHALDAELTLEAVQTLDAASATIDPVGIETVLVMIAHEDHVAVLVLLRAVGEVAVHVVRGEDGDLRCCPDQCIELWKERLAEIEITPVFHGIPLVRVPLMLVVHFVRTVRRIDRDDLFPREIALAMVEPAFISPCEAPLPAARRTERGIRHADVPEELPFHGRDGEAGATEGAI